ncbi:MAG: hypothetical protein DRZ90_04675 [Spirochaetes bacterium]|nr:MAG: hypothetical protein DRZ90_04675 [Spirochaetota bacterium]
MNMVVNEMNKILQCITLCAILFSASISLDSQENKTALVIGNSNYRHFSSLDQPYGEATAMAAALRRLGFDVTLLLNGSQIQMDDALIDFEEKLHRRGGLALFHYGGHGLQVDGSNYLIPVDANIPDERRVRSRALDVDEVIGAMDASGTKTNIVILDACRDNPLPASSRSTNSRGLAVVGRQPPDSIIVYAAAAGSTASDGLFTPTLLKYLETPGLEFSDLLRKVRTDVRQASGGAQRTGDYNQLESEIFLAGRGSGSPAPVAAVPAVRVQRPDNAGENMIFVPGGTFQMGSNSGDNDEKPIHSVTLSDFWMGKYEVTQGEWESVMDSNPSASSKGIGNNYPVNQVSWEDAVEYCNALSRREGLTPCYSGSGNSIRCNFNAEGYRLPTEAEWEYAARGGQQSRGYTYSGSNNLSSVGWHSENSGSKNHPVGGKQSNELGLYDMNGNVWEWCWDWYGGYTSSFRDPYGASSGSLRIYRGGSWYSNLSSSRAAVRGRSTPTGRTNGLGFRVARRL